MADKVLFATTVRDQATRLANLIAESNELVAAYFDRGFNGGGADPIIDGNVSGVGVTAAQVGSWITLAQQLLMFRDGVTIGRVDADYGSTMNVLRTDL